MEVEDVVDELTKDISEAWEETKLRGCAKIKTASLVRHHRRRRRRRNCNRKVKQRNLIANVLPQRTTNLKGHLKLFMLLLRL